MSGKLDDVDATVEGELKLAPGSLDAAPDPVTSVWSTGTSTARPWVSSDDVEAHYGRKAFTTFREVYIKTTEGKPMLAREGTDPWVTDLSDDARAAWKHVASTLCQEGAKLAVQGIVDEGPEAFVDLVRKFGIDETDPMVQGFVAALEGDDEDDDYTAARNGDDDDAEYIDLNAHLAAVRDANTPEGLVMSQAAAREWVLYNVQGHLILPDGPEGASKTGWVHTHGLAKRGLPELEVRDVSPLWVMYPAAMTLMDIAAYMVSTGKVIQAGHTYQHGHGPVLRFHTLPPMAGAEDHYQHDPNGKGQIGEGTDTSKPFVRLAVLEAGLACECCESLDEALEGEGPANDAKGFEPKGTVS